MANRKNTILVVDDNRPCRKIIRKILGADYEILEADNGKDALDLLARHPDVAMILLDLVMPIMGGFEFLRWLKESGDATVPVVVMTAENDKQMETRSLEAGAMDFISKPVDAEILRHRVRNALVRNELATYQKMEWLSTHDALTGLYNRRKMFAETRRMLDENPDTTFVFVHFDIDKFRLYNSVMGEAEGDRLLCFIAEKIRMAAKLYAPTIYGKVSGDTFCICCPYDKDVMEQVVAQAQKCLDEYRLDYRLKSSTGLYIIEDNSMSLELIYTRATLAGNACKYRYNSYYSLYDAAMGQQLEKEQAIMNEMRAAFEQEQFQVYLQPKYELSTDMPVGAEALVRWLHPTKGMIMPGNFIQIFEKNGCIARLDSYMWEHVCQLLHRWKAEGRKLAPISVNMSRVSLYNPHVAEEIEALVQKYDIPVELLHLEVTESAYMSNPTLIKETIEKLQAAGFTILMDDFGSGYSSLNTLKEINIDVLKLDMKFLPTKDDGGKAEKIISSIIRMSGWLGMAVIAEGVETKAQKTFLESVGCGYVQGYYFARPMPINEYEKLMDEKYRAELTDPAKLMNVEDSAFWSSDPRIEQILSVLEIPVLIIESSNAITEIIRTNLAYQKRFGTGPQRELYSVLSPDEEYKVRKLVRHAIQTGEAVSCDVSFLEQNGFYSWVRIKAHKLAQTANAALVCCIVEDITIEKINEARLENLIRLFTNGCEKKKILVVDDMEISRAIIRGMFEQNYEIVEAADGEHGLRALEAYCDDISVILLDMIMPKMDGRAFLERKNALPCAKDIPVIVISSEDDAAAQVGMLKNGVHDYIVKPFDPDITKQKVENVLANQKRFRELMQEYQKNAKR